ncbi:AI-2E family transporter|uniref:Predicted PurR-regulated permease PerM n=1 Tax=Dendrosporobacter quercicolus TaxID=146817 RepID=A0A1G9KUJ2_9FIRM|nr:AI-2E family transporter [Dendrosporobacter quercicolus]NSL46498.1 AI-2E family transporter [Dendrosporobacter quercicolus DSM 1736]SDL52975.1 Predicted PurR-regulated permease PerM [Dendrosporobacter quercicolus]
MIISKQQVRLSIILLVALAAVYFLWLVRSGLYPFIIGLFLAYLLNPAVCYLETKGFKRLWAILLLYILLFSILLGGGSQLIPLLVRELEDFGAELPQMAAKVAELIQMIQNQYQNAGLPFSMRTALDQAVLRMETETQMFVSAVAQGIVNMLSHAIGLVVSPVLAFYLLHDWYLIKEELLSLLPGRWRTEILSIFKDINKVLNGVIRGQIIIAVFVGMLISTGLYFLNLKYALLIGILAGVLDVIPYFGAIIGAAPAVAMALLFSPVLALKVALLFFVVHQLEGAVIQPKIMGESVGLHPLSVIFFVFIGGEVGGLAGMLLGVPLAAIGKVFIRHFIKLLV